MRHYASISKPLSAIVNTGPGTPMVWNDEAREAFVKLKEAISVTVKTYYLDYEQEIYLHTDA